MFAVIRFHFNPVRKKKDNRQQMLERMQKTGSPHALWVEIQIGSSTVEITGQFHRKLEINLPYDPAILLLDVLSKDQRLL